MNTVCVIASAFRLSTPSVQLKFHFQLAKSAVVWFQPALCWYSTTCTANSGDNTEVQELNSSPLQRRSDHILLIVYYHISAPQGVNKLSCQTTCFTSEKACHGGEVLNTATCQFYHQWIPGELAEEEGTVISHKSQT